MSAHFKAKFIAEKSVDLQKIEDEGGDEIGNVALGS